MVTVAAHVRPLPGEAHPFDYVHQALSGRRTDAVMVVLHALAARHADVELDILSCPHHHRPVQSWCLLVSNVKLATVALMWTVRSLFGPLASRTQVLHLQNPCKDLRALAASAREFGVRMPSAAKAHPASPAHQSCLLPLCLPHQSCLLSCGLEDASLGRAEVVLEPPVAYRPLWLEPGAT